MSRCVGAPSASIDSRSEEVIAMAALSIRNLDDKVKERLHVRAAGNGRSMEAEVRSILEDAVSDPTQSADLMRTLLDRFGEIGGVDLDLPERSNPPRAADLSA